MTSLLEALAGHCVLVIHHDTLISNPQTLEQTMREVRAVLDPARAEAVRPEVAPSAIDASLRHHRAGPDDVRAHATGRQLALFDYLQGLDAGSVLLDPPEALRVIPEEVAYTVRNWDIWVPGLKPHLEAIERSTSWRVTRPLRWLGDVRLRLRRRGSWKRAS
jgi:hypothetical protein